MSIATDVRGYTQTAFEQSRARFTEATGEVRGIANAAGDDAKQFLGSVTELARKQAYAALGAGELAYATVTKRAEEFSGDAKQNVDALQDRAETLAATGQTQLKQFVTELRKRGDQAVAEARDFKPADSAKSARANVEAQVQAVIYQAKAAFDAFAERGEKVAGQLLHDPRVAKAVSLIDRGEAKVTAPARPAATTKAPAAKKTTARKAPAKKPAAKKTTTRKATAKKA